MSDRPPLTPLQGWQREIILAAAAFLRDEFGNPPVDERARVVHDGLLEVLDPARRAVRLQQEMTDAARIASLISKIERSEDDRRKADRREITAGPPPDTAERRQSERRSGKDRRLDH